MCSIQIENTKIVIVSGGTPIGTKDLVQLGNESRDSVGLGGGGGDLLGAGRLRGVPARGPRPLRPGVQARHAVVRRVQGAQRGALRVHVLGLPAPAGPGRVPARHARPLQPHVPQAVHARGLLLSARLAGRAHRRGALLLLPRQGHVAHARPRPAARLIAFPLKFSNGVPNSSL